MCSDLIGARRSPDYRLYFSEWHIPLCELEGDCCSSSSADMQEEQAVTMSWGPHSPHFIQKSGLHRCQNQQLLTPGSCWDQNHTWFFPLHFKQWFIFSETFTTEVFWTEKETFWKYFAGLIFLLAQCTQPYWLVHSTAPVGDCQQELQFVQLGTSTSAHPWASLWTSLVPNQHTIPDFDPALQWGASEWEIRLREKCYPIKAPKSDFRCAVLCVLRHL